MLKNCLSVGLLWFCTTTLWAQKSDSLATPHQVPNEASAIGMEGFQDAPRGESGIRVMFYNTENFYYPANDSLTQDDDFTPDGSYHWSFERYNTKLDHIYKVIMGVGGWEVPAIIGMSELESRKVLEDLTHKTPLLKFDFGIIHEDSPDVRGIDVGVIYRKSKFRELSHQKLTVTFPFDTTTKTRDILYIKGIVLGRDTLHLLVNHWPSRRGGQEQSEPRRLYAASVARKKVEEIFAQNPQANIIVMGDMNDEPQDKSLHEVLKAKGPKEPLAPTDFYNYMWTLSETLPIGTEKFNGHWGIIDNITVSAPLYQRKGKGLKASPDGGNIFRAKFLLEDDERHSGVQPFRTYIGPKYHGGFSDHLPVYLDLIF